MPSYYAISEPAIIDETLLQKSMRASLRNEMELAEMNQTTIMMRNQGGDAEEDESGLDGALMGIGNTKEALDPMHMTCLSLEFSNILKIENLERFEHLTKLSLNNNTIERIENLDALRHLAWLDLSFNNIHVIENLDQLKMLTDLSLFENRITSMSGVEGLVNLEVLSLGNNFIEDVEQVAVLTKLRKLKSVILRGNPCAHSPRYNAFTLAHLRGLEYLDYRRIDSAQAKKAREEYLDNVISLEQAEKEEQSRQDKEREHAQKVHEMQDLRLAPMIDLIAMNITDLDPKILPESTTLPPDQFATLVRQIGSEWKSSLDAVKNVAKQYHSEQQAEVNDLLDCFKQGKQETDDISLQEIAAFQKSWKQMMRRVNEFKTIPKEYIKNLNTLYKTLMTREISLMEQMTDTLKQFDTNHTNLCDSSIQHMRAQFVMLKGTVDEVFGVVVNRIMMLFDQRDPEKASAVPAPSKEKVEQAIAAHREKANHLVEMLEQSYNEGIELERKQRVDKITVEEIVRNRNRVMEILNYKEHHEQEFRKAFSDD